ncbi:hypothetical protein QQ045_032984 [Rhodiola kirilowii]
MLKSSTMLSRSKLCRHLRRTISTPTPILQSTNTQFLNTHHRVISSPFSATSDSNDAAYGHNPPPESPELPGWLKFSKKYGPFYHESDGDFEIPEVSDWAQHHQKLLCNETNYGVGSKTVDQVEIDADEVSKVLKFRYESPDAAAEALSDKCGGVRLRVSEDLVLKLLNRFENDYVRVFGIFKWAKMQTGYEVSQSLYTQMVDILGKCKKFEKMWELVDEMHQSGKGFVTLFTMTKVIRRFAKAGMFNQAIDAFMKIESYGIKKDTASMNVLLDSLVKGGSVESAAVVFSDLESEISATCQTYNIFIHGWCKARKLEEAYKVLKEMEKRGIRPDTVTYTSLIEAYCREKDFRKVEETLNEMREKGCRPSVVTYTIYVHSLGKAKQLTQSFEVYEKMKKDGCVPDASFYSSLITHLGKSGRLDDALDLYKDMLKQDVIPNLTTYNSLISLYCLHSREADALKLLFEMKKNSVKPDVKTYDPLLKICCRKKKMKVLAFLLNHMFRNDVSPELGTYTLLVSELCKIEKPEHACLFFEEMVQTGYTPKESTYESLMKLLTLKGMVEAKGQIDMMYSSIREKLVQSPVQAESLQA